MHVSRCRSAQQAINARREKPKRLAEAKTVPRASILKTHCIHTGQKCNADIRGGAAPLRHMFLFSLPLLLFPWGSGTHKLFLGRKNRTVCRKKPSRSALSINPAVKLPFCNPAKSTTTHRRLSRPLPPTQRAKTPPRWSTFRVSNRKASPSNGSTDGEDCRCRSPPPGLPSMVRLSKSS